MLDDVSPQAFKARMRGAVVQPEGPDYDAARRGAARRGAQGLQRDERQAAAPDRALRRLRA